MSAASDQRDVVLRRDRGRCFAELTLPEHRCRKGDRMTCGHALPKSAIESMIRGLIVNSRVAFHPLLAEGHVLADVIFDPDCAFALCAGGHEAWDKLGKRCRLDQLPDHVHRWAARWWLAHRLAAYYSGGGVRGPRL